MNRAKLIKELKHKAGCLENTYLDILNGCAESLLEQQDKIADDEKKAWLESRRI